ncbi:hypothetical protein GSI_12703 [Ganoderma sinense ZZ0214-1]|uniref:Uncharacterized protein n=1 Tax=Ganoderma sinense ZZ0214-1 TaxID=1077348 RepID=A0A2G8RTH3_9APHY|nr:hypothetical protein GSI_12703 [Ganoderma sinense ZZ0214-1]
MQLGQLLPDRLNDTLLERLQSIVITPYSELQVTQGLEVVAEQHRLEKLHCFDLAILLHILIQQLLLVPDVNDQHVKSCWKRLQKVRDTSPICSVDLKVEGS